MISPKVHICKKRVRSHKSQKSQSISKTSSCECPPEYYCASICGEEFPCSISTIISWQHFPRSTSTRGTCDETSEETLKTITETPVESEKEEAKESAKLSSTQYPITKSLSQLQALHYLKIRHVFEFMNFLIGHLVCNEPDDPITFLIDLLDRCLRFRDYYTEAPQLITLNHIKSLYAAFDPYERGFVSLAQYREAMNTLNLTNGIVRCNLDPPKNDDGLVAKKYFLFEAERCMSANLRLMLRVPEKWEEDRLIWERRMGKKLKEMESDSMEVESVDHEQNDEVYCKCSGVQSINNLICRCEASMPSTPTVCNEPEQLFFEKSSY